MDGRIQKSAKEIPLFSNASSLGETLFLILFHFRDTQRLTPIPMMSSDNSMRLYSKTGQRLYLNESERQAFTIAASVFDLETEALCLFLLHTGCRLSEALNVIASDIQSAEAIIAIRSLKKRDQHHVREIPLPPEFAEQLNTLTMTKPDEIVWAMSRTTAWRKVTRVM